MFDKLSREFELLFGFRAVCTKFMAPSYHENLELGVLEEEMIKFKIPITEKWKVIENYGKTKYKLHQ